MKQILIELVFVVIGLVISKCFKLLVNKNFNLSNFDNNFWMATCATVVAIFLVKQFVDSESTGLKKVLTDWGYTKQYDKNGKIIPEDTTLRIELIALIVETILVSIVPIVVKSFLLGNTVSIDNSIYTTTFIAICSGLIYKILIEPIINKNVKPKSWLTPDLRSSGMKALSKAFVIVASDYMVDFELDVITRKDAAAAAIGEISGSYLKSEYNN